MRIVRFSDGSSPCYGALDDGSTRIVGLKGDPLFAAVEPSGRVFELDEVRLLSPVIPRSKVVGVAGNYSDEPVPDAGRTRPPLFLKANTSVIGPDDPIAIPAWSDDVVFEGELAVVIKSLAKDVPVEEAHQVVLGYTVANDATARDAVDGGPWARGKSFDTACPLGPWITVDPGLDPTDLAIRSTVNGAPARDAVDGGPWARGKSFDTACPLGPWITVDPGLDPTDLAIRSTVNGAPAQDGSSADMIWNVFELVSYASMAFTLLPGDVVITGAPPGCGPVKAGDRVEITIEGIGTLSNPVVRA